MRILVVEDDGGVRDAMAAILRDEGHEVWLAASGRAALDRLGADPLPDVILLDLMMPQMDGESFRRAQVRDPRLAPIRVVVVSARPDVAVIARQIGIDGYLRKPMSFDELLAAIERCRRD